MPLRAMPPTIRAPAGRTRAEAGTPCALTRGGAHCDLQGVCASISTLGLTKTRLKAGQLLYAQGDPVKNIYCVQHGCLKTAAMDANGVERVHAFHLPSELAGLDGIGAQRYPSEVSAVSNAEVTVLPLDALYTGSAQSPADSRVLLGRLGRALAGAEARAGDYPVDTRIAAFLVDMHTRLAPTETTEKVVTLPMPRRDIAMHLRIAPETVSRSLQRLSSAGLIRVSGKRIHFEDVQALRAVGGTLCCSGSGMLQEGSGKLCRETLANAGSVMSSSGHSALAKASSP